MPRSYREYNWGQPSQFSTGVCEEGREHPFRVDLSVEAEEFPLLEAVTRERLMKTAGWKTLRCAVVI
jgi:hypothetical protein